MMDMSAGSNPPPIAFLPDKGKRLAALDRLLDRHAEGIQYIVKALRTDFEVPPAITVATIKRRLSRDPVEGRASIIGRPELGKSIAKLAGQLACCGMAQARTKRPPPIVTQVLFEWWIRDASRMYRYVFDRLPGVSTAVMARTTGDYEGFGPVALRPWTSTYEPSVARRLATSLVKRAPRLIRLSRRSKDADYLFLYLVLLRKFGQYSTDMEGISARLMISGGDIDFAALRYHIYRTSGIRHLLLMQNGMIGGFAQDSFICTDTYCTFGAATPALLPGLTCRTIRPVGSHYLHAALKRHGIVDQEFDVTLVEQVSPHDWPGAWLAASYIRMVDNFVLLSRARPDLRFCFVIRDGRHMPSLRNLVEQVDRQLHGTNIIMSDEAGVSSYDVVKGSRVVVAYTSTLGWEAMAMGKRVLLCNYDHFGFLPGGGEPAGITDPSPNAFRKKVEELLTGGQEIDDYFRRLGSYVVQQHDDPSGAVAATIREILAGKLPAADIARWTEPVGSPDEPNLCPAPRLSETENRPPSLTDRRGKLL